MDDRRRSLRFALGLLVSLVTSPAYGQAPVPQASQPPSLQQVEDALTGAGQTFPSTLAGLRDSLALTPRQTLTTFTYNRVKPLR